METRDYMALALVQAKAAGLRGEVPVGAVLVDSLSGAVLAENGNRVEGDHDATAHAEMLVLRAGCQAAGAARLPACDLYVTLEPCAMCAQALALARIRRLYFGAYDPKGGGVDHGARVFDHRTCHHKPEVYGGFDESQASALLKSFFAARRG
ncbi:MAG: nucleoside deaminase [Alphaproteobacteria bacterium]